MRARRAADPGDLRRRPVPAERESARGAAERVLRVGVLIDSVRQPRWVYESLRGVLALSCVRVVLVLESRREEDRAGRGGHSLLFRLYERWDYFRRRGADDAFQLVDCSNLLPGEIARAAAGSSGDGEESEAALVSGADLDVLLHFGRRALSRRILEMPRFGVWSYRHGVGGGEGDEVPLFAALRDRDPICVATLYAQPAAPGRERILHRSLSRTHFGSLYKTRNALHWKAADFVPRCLRRLAETGRAEECVGAPDPEGAGTGVAPTGEPGTWAMLRFLVRRARFSLVERLRRLFLVPQSHWLVAYRRRDGETPGAWSVLRPPADRFYADPFPLHRDGRSFLFFEDYRYRTGRGVISVSEIGEGGVLSPPRLALETPVHLSYPFVFEHGGEVFMIPESKALRRIDLYRAVQLPGIWRYARTLIEDVEAVDATIWIEDGTFWLFCNVADRAGSTNEDLHVFYSGSLTGPWRAHPQNPVVSDIRSARPAGRLYRENGRLIRPSQDCSSRYGHAVCLNEVEVLDRERYRERPIDRIEPDWMPGIVATHTRNHAGPWEVRDGDTRLRRWWWRMLARS